MSPAGKKVGNTGEERERQPGELEVTGRAGPSLGQQEQGMPGKQEPRGDLVPSQPEGKLKEKNIR